MILGVLHRWRIGWLIQLSVFWSALFLSQGAQAAEPVYIAAPSGEEIPTYQFQAEGDRAILWIPSGFGIQPPQLALGTRLTQMGIETWVTDMHQAYFLERGRRSVESFRTDDIVHLVDLLGKRGKRSVYLMTTGRGALPALKAARVIGATNSDRTVLKGLVLFHPSLYINRPALGEDANLDPVTYEQNLPVFVLQTELSSTYTRFPELLQALRTGGATVFAKTLIGVVDGFHLRPDDHLSPQDKKARDHLPRDIVGAIAVLDKLPRPPPIKTIRKPIPRSADTLPGIKLYPPRPSPDLRLFTMGGKQQDINELRGKVLLVSFWASWCPPCVREMPSMNRLRTRLQGSSFEIVGINVGEPPEIVRSFLEQTRVDFPVLLDPDRKAYLDWKVYVVPTNYLVDKQGNIIGGSVGAIDWESEDVVALIEKYIHLP